MKFVNISLASLLAAQPAVAMTVKGFRKQNDPARNLKKTKKEKKAKNPTNSPTKNPTVAPTMAPTMAPTTTPTMAPTMTPTTTPTMAPTMTPTTAPTMAPTASPTSPVPEALVCYSSETTTLTAAVDTTTEAPYDMQGAYGTLEFGVISVPATGGDVMLDINASTGGVTNRGNNLDDDDTVMRYAFFSDYIVSLGVNLRPGCTTSIGCTSAALAPVPNAVMVLNGMQDLQALAQDDFKLAGDDGLFDSQSRIHAVSGRFFVPDLAPGDYLIEIAVMIGAIAAMDIADDEDWYSDTTVVLGPHIIVAQVLQATNRVCDPSMYMEVM
jgi:hypothetical protein